MIMSLALSSISETTGNSATLEQIRGTRDRHHGFQLEAMTNSPTLDQQLAVHRNHAVANMADP